MTSTSASASKKQYSHHVGLTNLGNTCYLGSSLQILFSNVDFMNDLKESHDNLNSIENNNNSLPLCFALLTVASRLGVIQPLLQGKGTRDGPACPFILKNQMDILTDEFDGYELQSFCPNSLASFTKILQMQRRQREKIWYWSFQLIHTFVLIWTFA